MADEAEDIGGISVSVGASHARLPGDLAEIDRLIENHFANGRTVQIRAELQGVPSQGGRAVGAPGASAPATVTAAPTAVSATATNTALEAKMDKLISSMSVGNARAAQRVAAEAEQVTINGVRVGGLSNLQTSLQKAIEGTPVTATAEIEQASAKINELRVDATQPMRINLGTEEAQAELSGILGTLREIAAELSTISRAPVAAAGGRGGSGGGRRAGAAAAVQPGGEDGEEGTPQGLRRKNLRDRAIGTEVNPNAVYTYGTTTRAGYTEPGVAQVGTAYTSGEPDVYDEEERRREARATQDRELAARSSAERQTRAERTADRVAMQRARRADQRTPRSPGILDQPNQQAQSRTPLEAAATTFVPGRDDQPVGRGGYAFAAPPVGGGGGGGRSPRDIAREAFDQRQAPSVAAAFAASRRVRQYTVDEEAQEQTVRSRVAATTGSGRTSRTLASGLGAIFGGTERRQFEAQAAAAQTRRQLESTQKAIEPLDSELRRIAGTWQASTGAEREFAREQFHGIRNNEEYKQALVNVKGALKENAVAEENLNKISGIKSVARNLVAITAAGAGFGLALTAVGAAVHTIVPALGDAIDKATGFGATSNKVTQALAQQTLAVHGNVDAVLAQAEAQAGLSAASTEALESQLKLTTQVKAGAGAAAQAGGLFRAAIGANQQTPQGLLGGYGGIGGGAVLGSQLGGGTGFAETIASTFADFKDATAALQTNRVLPENPDLHQRQYLTAQQQAGAQTPTNQRPAEIARIAKDRLAAETGLNDAAKRGAEAMGLASTAVVRFGYISDEVAKSLQTSNLPTELKELAKSNEALFDSNGNLIRSYGDAVKGLQQAAVGQGIAPPEQLGRANLFAERQREREAAANLPAIQAQQEYERPSQIALVQRQTEYQTQYQMPAQLALSAMANPNLPVGTGIARGDRASVSGDLKDAQNEQNKLNALYKQGQQVIEDTYRPDILAKFGTAALATFDTSLAAVVATGKQIASIQASISNEQAAYQVAQYNYQLVIARRTLSDIGGLTGKNFGAGQSYLGVLERQNLALSRQAQQLQFALSQRQINFQTALAGFQAPGITPEERQARVAEAKIEAGFAQKQLDIQRQMFGNQVQIVDIGNLRQGADLARQIGLLLQGRQVTIDTAAAQQKLIRLQQLQAENVKRVSAYLNAVDNLAGQAFSQIQRLEAAAGKAMSSVATTVLKQFGLVLRGLTAQLNQFSGEPVGQISYGGAPGAYRGASGLLGMTAGPTNMLVGEAGGEAVAILRNPKAVTSGMGGTNVVVQFNGDIHTDSTADLAKITQAVVKALGRDASLKGLRGIG